MVCFSYFRAQTLFLLQRMLGVLETLTLFILRRRDLPVLGLTRLLLGEHLIQLGLLLLGGWVG
jgi:hypothetical protein